MTGRLRRGKKGARVISRDFFFKFFTNDFLTFHVNKKYNDVNNFHETLSKNVQSYPYILTLLSLPLLDDNELFTPPPVWQFGAATVSFAEVQYVKISEM